MTVEDASMAVRAGLSQAVYEQLISDVPLGAFLSGGLDSSSIVALMRPHVKELNTFSIKFDRPGYDESPYARIVSGLFNTVHHQIQFDASTVRELIEQLPYFYDEPFADPSMIPTCLISRVARKHVTVALSGTGGDELFAGYPRHLQIGFLLRINHLPGLLKHLIDLLVSAINLAIGSDLLNKLRAFLGPKRADSVVYLTLFSYMFRNKTEWQMDLERFRWLKDCFCYDDTLTNVLNFDTNHYLSECLLTKEDRASMAVSLEARVPFLDLELVELAASIPSRFKISGLQKKYVLKKAVEGLLPRQIIYRRKQGFGVPLAQYLRQELRDLAFKEVFDDLDIRLYDRSILEQAWQQHQSGRSDYSRLFWSVIMFNRWFKRWMQ
jgi:asparagine synthase (glutamine-hydrolysing)